jgi:predicted RNA binding protein YcfA (HicA-like mRNA interferase family)
MGSLKLCSGAEAVKKFIKAGWSVSRQKGSHVMMVKEGYEYTLSNSFLRSVWPGEPGA